ncbi:MAG: serine protease [Chloroflexi bacterium]|nr:serine protease [Chloroflexota bacterium]
MVRVVAPLGLGTAAQGSGVVIWANPNTGEARLLTAYHVIDEAPKGIEVSIVAEPGPLKDYPAEIVSYDPDLDIAVLSVCCSKWFLAAEFSQDIPERGDTVYAVGFDSGRERVIADRGEIIGAKWPSLIGADVDADEGHSGGALVTAKTYEVIGIITAEINEDARLHAPEYRMRELAEELGTWWPPYTVVAVWVERVRRMAER